MEEKRNACRIFVRELGGKSYLEDQDVGGWIILKRILRRERNGMD
jgi:hypothetical protein